MSAYDFQLLRTYVGDELDDTEDAKQIMAAAEIGLGIKAKTPAKFRDAYVKKNDFDADEISVQVSTSRSSTVASSSTARP